MHIIPSLHREQLTELLEWLCQTPTITSVRVNRHIAPDIRTSITQNIHAMFASGDDVGAVTTTTAPPSIEWHRKLPDLITISPLAAGSHHCNKEDVEGLGEIIVDVTCGAAILRGAHLYAPGVLAMPARTALGERVRIFADIAGACKRGSKVYDGVDAERKVLVGVGVVRQQRHRLFVNTDNVDDEASSSNNKPSGIAVEVQWTRSGVPAIGDGYFSAGSALLQNLPSVVCGHVLGARPGERVLDMCAAPGNKTTHVAQMMRLSAKAGDDDVAARGELYALDKTDNKLAVLRERLRTFGLEQRVHSYAFDATRAVQEDAASTSGESSSSLPLQPPFAPHTFDRILLDGPCSALGNRPQLRNDMSPRMLASYPVVQRKLLRTAVELLRPGGVLVYSTCTVAAAENETMVAWLLEKMAGRVELVAAEPLLGGSGWSGCGLNDAQR